MSKQFIFNQYYIDLIKRIKASAKKMKEAEASEAVEGSNGRCVRKDDIKGNP